MATGGLQRQVTLPPAPDSARHARRLVHDVCAMVHADHFCDTAELLASELVTNGIVHAHTDLRVVVEATDRWVRVEVVDGSPHLPSRRDYDEQAATGRGLEMVDLLSDEFGIDAMGGEGKRVWFRLGVTPGTPEPEPAAPRRTPTSFPLAALALPVELYCAWQTHADALLREAVICALDEDPTGALGDYPLAGDALSALAEAAAEVFRLRDAGVETADVTLPVASDAVPWFPILRDRLRRAGAMSDVGQLLVPPMLPEMRALYDWLCDEMARQSAGLAAQPWTGAPDDAVVPTPASPEVLASVRESPAALVAADALNRIVAVSAPAAALLGWQPGDLEGRRLVTIIPPRLRDRHLAGFTRHLVDGSRTILGRSVDVPALRRDGTEVPVSLLIERRHDPAARVLFVATLTPV